MSHLERPSYASLRKRLPAAPPLYNPVSLKPDDAKLNVDIADAQIHPTLEAALHLLNGDLTSAHFLVRRLQSDPAFEGMFLHAILHRIEGDYENAKCWYRDIASSDVFARAWSSRSDANDFVDAVKAIKNTKVKDRDGSEEERLVKEGQREMEEVLKWCEEKFGTERWEDVTKEYVESNDRIQDKKEAMLVGGEGWRNF